MPGAMKFGYLLGFRNPPGSGIDFPALYSELLQAAQTTRQDVYLRSVWFQHASRRSRTNQHPVAS